MKNIKLILAMFIGFIGFAQENSENTYQNSGNKLLNDNLSKGITIGGYAQIDYNEPDGSKAGKLDVHRLVLLFGYKFNEKVSFLTEVEYEHVQEVYVEQAYIQYKLNKNVNVLAGLMLVPMGIINEYHEPTTFYGVERPNVDNSIVPTTWRELGAGISGRIDNASLKYQAYVFNGFKSYAGEAGVLRGSDGLRKGRQKGAESVVSSPNFSTKLDYYGIMGLRIGLSGYFGKTQTDDTSVEGSTIGISMIGLDARYKYNNLELRGQYINADLSDTNEYNTLTGKDLGSKMNGLYAEIAYGFDLKGEEKLTPFLRYEKYNTHAETEGSLVANKAFDKNELVFGLNYKVADGAAFKVDYQLVNNAVSGSNAAKQFNAGVAIWF
ncbi:porin [Lutibacter sp.]|uniref:porin n=1 Tax=Lutibacter sp. TaxID=1925666 RepID=UPI0035685D7F